MPHPSPTYVCTSPDVGDRIAATLRAAAAVIDDPHTAKSVTPR